MLLLLPLAAAWRWLDRPAGSIAQALAISVRPMLGILIIWQLLRRKWRAVLWTMAAGLVLILLTLPFVGLSGYLDYLTVLRNLSGVTGVEFNYDLSSVVVGLGLDESAAGLVLLAGYALAIIAIVLSLRRDRELGFIVTVSASLLLSPLLWDHYLAMLVLPAAFLANRGHWALVLPLRRGCRAPRSHSWLSLPCGSPSSLRPSRARSHDHLYRTGTRHVTQPASYRPPMAAPAALFVAGLGLAWLVVALPVFDGIPPIGRWITSRIGTQPSTWPPRDRSTQPRLRQDRFTQVRPASTSTRLPWGSRPHHSAT